MLLQVAAAQTREEAVDILLQRGYTWPYCVTIVLMSGEGHSQIRDFKKRTNSDIYILTTSSLLIVFGPKIEEHRIQWVCLRSSTCHATTTATYQPSVTD